MRCAVLVGVLLAIAGPAGAQGTTDFPGLLSGKDVPLTLKAKDLNAEWRRVGLITNGGTKGGNPMEALAPLMQLGMAKGGNGKPDDAASAMLGMSFLSMMFGGGGQAKEPVYYTKGQTVTAGGETFLVVYEYRKPEMNLMRMMADSQKNGGNPPDFTKMAADAKMSGDSPLTLSLINVKSIASLTGVRPFDLAREIEENSQDGGLFDMLGAQAQQQGGGDVHVAPVLPKKKAPAKSKPAVRRVAGLQLSGRS